MSRGCWGTGALDTSSIPGCRCLWPPPEGTGAPPVLPWELLSPASSRGSAVCLGEALPTCTFSFAQLEPRLSSMRACMASRGGRIAGRPLTLRMRETLGKGLWVQASLQGSAGDWGFSTTLPAPLLLTLLTLCTGDFQVFLGGPVTQRGISTGSNNYSAVQGGLCSKTCLRDILGWHPLDYL